MQLAIFLTPDKGLDVSPQNYPPEFRMAMLSIADDLENLDIYEIARKLAELLLEQLS